MHETFNVPPLLAQVAVAVATGALIGLERERLPDRKFAGLRTLALLCGMGPVAVSLGTETPQPAVLLIFLSMYLGLAGAIAIAVAYVRFKLDEETIGFTTSVTVFLVALLGVLIGYERFFESTSIAILTVLLLAERERLHKYVGDLSDEELRDSVKLGALVFVLYPILPTEPIDPGGIIVLRDVLLFAIFVLLIQFGSYISMGQLGGSTGLAVTGLLAGGANSFAAAGVLARLANQSRDALTSASFALLLATGSMIVRNVAIAVALAVPLFWVVWQPALVMLVVTLAAAATVWLTGDTDGEFDIGLDSPFSFKAAAKFSVAYVVILLISDLSKSVLGDAGLYATAFAGGLVSSAAVSVSAATVFNDGAVGANPAAGMVIFGIAASLASKIGLVEFVNKDMRREAVVPMILIGSTGLGFLVFVI